MPNLTPFGRIPHPSPDFKNTIILSLGGTRNETNSVLVCDGVKQKGMLLRLLNSVTPVSA